MTTFPRLSSKSPKQNSCEAATENTLGILFICGCVKVLRMQLFPNAPSLLTAVLQSISKSVSRPCLWMNEAVVYSSFDHDILYWPLINSFMLVLVQTEHSTMFPVLLFSLSQIVWNIYTTVFVNNHTFVSGSWAAASWLFWGGYERNGTDWCTNWCNTGSKRGEDKTGL